MSAYLLECIDCGRRYLPDEAKYLCPLCGESFQASQPLPGLLRCIYDYENLSRQFGPDVLAERAERGLGRWAELLPLASLESLPPLIESATPLRPALRLGQILGIDDLWLKDDTGLPTASLKDRASAMVVACARERGCEVVATASTGNAATALAGMAASVDLESVVFVPASAPPAKLAQIAIYGSRLIPIDGNYDQAFSLSIEACEEFGWYCRNTAYNPFTVEGKKTAALEIWEQLNYSVPDWIVVPTGDGVILAGIEKAFSDLAALNLIKKIPRLALIQAAGCQPLVRAINEGRDEVVPEVNPRSLADSIAVGVPRAGRWALKAIRDSKGTAIAVSDAEILEAMALLGRTTGIFAEPAASASIAGVEKLSASGMIRPDERVVALITGNGLKDVSAAMEAVSLPKPVKSTIDAVRQFIKQGGKS
jgi:threonine synthase